MQGSAGPSLEEQTVGRFARALRQPRRREHLGFSPITLLSLRSAFLTGRECDYQPPASSLKESPFPEGGHLTCQHPPPWAAQGRGGQLGGLNLARRHQRRRKRALGSRSHHADLRWKFKAQSERTAGRVFAKTGLSPSTP